jgi:hypothetical protein
MIAIAQIRFYQFRASTHEIPGFQSIAARGSAAVAWRRHIVCSVKKLELTCPLLDLPRASMYNFGCFLSWRTT